MIMGRRVPGRETPGSRRRPRSRGGCRGCRRGYRRGGSARRAAPSHGGRDRSASRSPRACRRTTLLVGAPPQPLDRDLVRHLELEDDGKRPLDLGQHRVERLGLRHRARKPVEDEPSPGVVCLQSLADELDHQVVGHELAALKDRLAPAAELRAVGIARRRMSPVAMCARPYSDAIRLACVPLPDPWTPRSNTSRLTT